MAVMQAEQRADPPVAITRNRLEKLTTPGEVETAVEQGWRLLDERHGRMIDERQALTYTSDGKSVLAGPDPLPDRPDEAVTATYYHATPELNTPDILDAGLDVSPAENAPTGDGVYVAPSRVDAERWADVICDEEGWQCFDVLRVEVPECLPVLRDERLRDAVRHRYPDSKVVATAYGVPPRFIEVEREEYVADESLAP